jgi:hypothetical protein
VASFTGGLADPRKAYNPVASPRALSPACIRVGRASVAASNFASDHLSPPEHRLNFHAGSQLQFVDALSESSPVATRTLRKSPPSQP